MDVLYFVVPLVLSAVLIFPTKMVAKKFKLYAKINKRTIHHGNIPRIGGVAIFISFVLCSVVIFKQSPSLVKSIVPGASVIFLEGLLDDIFDMKPRLKLLFQFIAATLLIFVGELSFQMMYLPFGITIHFKVFAYLITYIWVIGITNAINLIDGLDGLAAGFSIIVLMTMSILSTVTGLRSAFPICLMLAGATMGFLFFNFHPASIFMGDCGAQFLGFMIAAISLYGFKSTTFISLTVPIILLFIPILDTLSAIVRRKLKGESFSTADKSHFHHQLMNGLGLGQTGAVLTIYVVATLFSITAYVYVLDQKIGFMLLLLLVFMFEIFIEYTDMISTDYRPILNLFDKITKKNRKKG